MHEAAVLAECAANPDDDAPRLVWADTVGGERGELVVIQCDLARGDLTPGEVAVRRRRERELLASHSLAWAGVLAEHAARWSFRRGFVEAARLTSFDREIVTQHPLLTSVSLGEEHALKLLPVVATHIALRGLEVPSAPPHFGYLEAGLIDRLRSLALAGVRPQHFEDVRTLVARAPLEQLWLPEHRLAHDQVRAVLEAAPGLRALGISSALGHYFNFAPPLRALHVDRVDLGAVRASSANTLVHLHAYFDSVLQASMLEACTALRSLEVFGAASEAVVAQLPTTLAALRALTVTGAIYERPLRAIVDHYGAQLEMLEVPTGTSLDGIEITGELRKVDGVRPAYRRELLHHDPAAMFELGEPLVARTPPACLVEASPTGKVWDVGNLPAEEPVLIGRNAQCTIQVASTSVSNRHAELLWSARRHVIRDLGSANGTAVNDMAGPEHPLADGDEITLGHARLIYLVGHDARARSTQVRAATATIEPTTRLQCNPSPPIRILIENWAEVSQYGDAVMRDIAGYLRWSPDRPTVWFVEPGVFGTDSPVLARRMGVTVFVEHAGQRLGVRVIALLSE
jgi:FHA domain